jgi:hypothetical protein
MDVVQKTVHEKLTGLFHRMIAPEVPLFSLSIMASSIRSSSPINQLLPLLSSNYNALIQATTAQNESAKNYLLKTRIYPQKVSDACVKMRSDIQDFTATLNSIPPMFRCLLPPGSPTPQYQLDTFYTTVIISPESFKKKPFKDPYGSKFFTCASDWVNQNNYTDFIYDATSLKLLGFYELVVQNTNFLSEVESRFVKNNFRAYVNRIETFTHTDFVVFKNELWIQFYPDGVPQ